MSIHESADAVAATQWWATSLGVSTESFARPTIKHHGVRTNRKNVSDDYHGCVIVTVARSREIYWRVAAVMATLAKQVGSDQVVSQPGSTDVTL